MPPPAKVYAQQAERYNLSNTVDRQAAIDLFRQDVQYGEQANLAVPIVGLFLAAARTVGKLRVAPLPELTPDDIWFPQQVQSLLNVSLRGLVFRATRKNRLSYDKVVPVGDVVLRAVELDTGFGYVATDGAMGSSPDGIVFNAKGPEELFVDCADLSGRDRAQYRTHLHISLNQRVDLLERVDASGFTSTGGYTPEPPQEL